MRLKPLMASAVGGVLISASFPVQAASPEPPLVNEELVVADVDASGLPVDATLYSRVVARNYPKGLVRDPSSTKDLVYMDRRGAPAVEGQDAVIEIGGAGQTTVTTRASFDKPLPVALHAEYRQGPTVLAPDSVEQASGEMTVVYTVTNTTAEQTTIRYRDASGKWTVEKQPVFAPFVATLVATLPEGLTLEQAPRAIRNTTSDGRTQLQWNLVLYPPMGNYQQEARMVVSGDPLAIPGLTVQVLPVKSSQDPTLGFSSDLLASSVEGNEVLAEGLVQLDESATTLASGAADLGRGLLELGEGTSELSNGVNGKLVPGSRQLAQGADKLADGQGELAGGANKLAKGQRKAATGTKSAYDGAKSLEDGAEKLGEGLLSLYDGIQELLKPDALPKARDSSDQLAQAVLRLHDVIGSPSDPDIGFPPTQASTLIQAVRALQKTAGLTSAGAVVIKNDLKDIATKLASLATDSGQAAVAAGSAESQAGLVYQQACVDAVILNPVQCATLQQAVTDAGTAAQKSTDVSVGLGVQSTRTAAQAIAVAAVALALQGITAALGAVDQALTQISVSLASGNTDAPGVYEGLNALTDGLTATINGLVKLSNGSAQSAGGAEQLTVGSQDLADGLNDLADGAEDLAQGSADLAEGTEELADGGRELAEGTSQQAEATRAVGDALSQVDAGVDSAAGGADQLADGADQLQEQGTAEVLNKVIKASKDPALAKAYLAASQERAADALPYGAPDGAAGRVAYIYTMPGSQQSGTASSLAGWGLLAVIAAAAVAVAWRRLHPVEAAAPAVEAATVEAPPIPDTPPADLPPVGTDDDWPFRPQ